MADQINVQPPQPQPERSGNSALAIAVIIIVLAIAGLLLWQYLPAREEATPEEDNRIEIDINLPNGGDNNPESDTSTQ